MRTPLLVLLALSAAAAGAVRAQPAGPGFRTLATVVDAARARGGALPAPLAQRVDAVYDGEPLARVLDDLARRSGVGIGYAGELDGAPRVRLRAERLPVAEVLLRATRGSGYTAWVDAGGQVVVRRDAPGGRAAPRAEGAGRGAVRLSGYVRRADTREVVRYAALTADDSARARSNADGFFVLRVAPGTRRVSVRALGFAPLDTALDLADDASAVELALTPAAVALARVDVEAGRTAPDVDPRSPDMSVGRVDMPTLRRAPAVLGEVDPVRSLTLLPGVSRTSDFSTAFSVRGGGADQNLILLDDATIYNPAHVLGFLSVFNSDAVDDVTLHKGAIPARFGGRLSSVLDVRQREGNAREFAGSATVGLLASRASVEGPLPGRRGSYLVAARRSYADLFLRAARDTALRNNAAYFYDVNGKATVALGAAGRLMASGYAGRDAFTASDDFGARWGNVSGTARWTQAFGGRLFSAVTASASDYDYGLRFLLVSDSVRWTSRIRSRALRVDQTWHLAGGHALEFGGELVAETVRPGDVTAADTTNVTPVRIPPRHGRTAAAYVGHSAELGPRLALRYGARLSGFWRRGPGVVYRYADGAPVTWNAALARYEPGALVDSVRHGDGAAVARYGAVEPRASVRFALTRNASLKASYARTAQYLLLASRTNTPTPLDVWEPVGPYLRPLRADQVALGWAGTLGGGAYEVSAEVYAKRMRNVVDFIDGTDIILNPRLETGIVQGVGRARGLELFARRKAGRTTGWVSYTLARAEQRFAPGLAPGAGIAGGRWFVAPADKTHDLSVVALRPLRGRWTLGATFAAASGLPTTFPQSRYEIDGLVVPEYGPRNGTRLPAYHRLDLAVTREGARGDLQFGVYNAYNRFNAQSIAFREAERAPGRTEAVQLSVFGIVPSVSYTRRF
jgi:hypothetical protein